MRDEAAPHPGLLSLTLGKPTLPLKGRVKLAGSRVRRGPRFASETHDRWSQVSVRRGQPALASAYFFAASSISGRTTSRIGEIQSVSRT